MKAGDPEKQGKRSRPKRKRYTCYCCRQDYLFCWTCTCGFEICQACMHENLWGMTCNNVTWVCPDCGEVRSY